MYIGDAHLFCEMKIVFFTNNYMPKPFANGVCVHALAKESVRQGWITHVVCTGNWRTHKSEVIDGVIVHKLRVPFYKILFDYHDNHKTALLGKIAYKLGRLIALGKKLIHISEYPLQDQCLVKRYVKECRTIISGNEEVILVATYTPMEGIKAGALLKKRYPNIRAVYYSLDTLSNEAGYGFLPERIRSTMGIEQELKYFDIYDKILLMNCHKKHYEAFVFSDYCFKMLWADFPLFLPLGDIPHRKTLMIVYTGTLYRGIRNPRPALELLSSILDTYSVHFYGHSDCDDILDEFALIFPGHVVNHGLVPHKEALRAVSSADILLSIGNAHTEMAPSKIYEQMSTGKPIIHVYSEKNDPCLPLLIEYNNALCVDTNNVAQVDINHFINGLKYLGKTELEGKFKEASPQYSLKAITELDENC